MEEDILGKNNLLASRNRGYFEAKGVVALNLMSSPGSGKTTLLEKTIKALEGKQMMWLSLWPVCILATTMLLHSVMPSMAAMLE